MSKQIFTLRILTILKDLLVEPPRQFDCLQVEVSSRCFGRCSYCPHTVLGKEWRGRDMELATFRRLRPLMRRAVRAHLQGWGEPLLNPAFFTMAALARRAGCAVSTTTSGLGLTEKMATELVAAELDIVALSLVGTDEKSNSPRAGISFNELCRAVELLQNAKRASQAEYPKIHFAYLLLASNMAAISGLPALMQGLGVDSAVVSTLDYLPSPEQRGEAFLADDQEKLAAAAAILAETAATARGMDKNFHYNLPNWQSGGSGCGENIDRSLFVTADGEVTPCVFRGMAPGTSAGQGLTFGNVNTMEPLAIWDSPDYHAFRGAHRSGTPDAVCRLCPKHFIGKPEG